MTLIITEKKINKRIRNDAQFYFNMVVVVGAHFHFYIDVGQVLNFIPLV